MTTPDHPYRGAQAEAYAEATQNLDLASLRDRFLKAVRVGVKSRRRAPGPTILDLGCGSGRDARAFLEAGCTVVATDPSPELARIASAHAGIPVRQEFAQELSHEAAFDGIWACASLLHVPWEELPDVFGRIEQALRPGGVLYASFRLGSAQRTERGLPHTDMTPERLRDRIARAPALAVDEHWVTDDVRADRSEVQWLNALLRREISSV